MKWETMILLGSLVVLGLVLGIGKSMAFDDFEKEPVLYSATEPTDRIAGMIALIKAGVISFDTSSEKAFVADVLDKLNVPVDSQVLVFSKTSLQNTRIMPSRPRALYFSDNCYVGWVRGGDLEIISVDPNIGPVFYRLEVPRGKTAMPRIDRTNDCLSCHGTNRTGNVPGMLVRSVFPDDRGNPILGAGTYQSETSSPLSERWGGWYVTGKHAGPRHMGNIIYETRDDGGAVAARDMGEMEVLDGVIDTSSYLRNTSDIVALMVLEHQVTIHNVITQSHLNTRRWLHDNRVMAELFDEPADVLRESTRRLIANQADTLLDHMLFKDEFELESWGVEGANAFQVAFCRDVPRSSDGRSLKDFQLLSRLFKHRLSYMIYSQAFEQTPEAFKTVFYEKLWDVLQGGEARGRYSYLSDKECERILSILIETKSELPAYWHVAS